MIKELIEGPNVIGAQSTTFTLDHQGRFLCNTLQEAFASTGQVIAGRKRDFDVIVIGGGTFGSVIAEHLFANDTTRSRRILVLEAGPFVLPEHVQNMPFQGGAPNTRVPWVNHPSLAYSGLIYAIGGRSLTWGGWSPELLDEEWAAWPQSVRDDLRPAPPKDGYFARASRQIGVKETNDFIYGPLHIALRKQLHAGLNQAGNETGFTFADLLDHPAVRYPDPGEPPLTVDILRDWLGLPTTDTTPMAELLELFKLEAPLAVSSTTLPGQFPTNKYSAVPGLIRSVRLAGTEAADIDAAGDARKRFMVVPNCHVQDLITETQADNWVRVTGVRVWQNGTSTVIPLAAPRDGGQSAVVIALGTVETTRIALTTFQQSLAERAAQRMGTNLIAHLRSNLTIRIPKAAIAANLPPTLIPSLQCSALLVKGKASNGRTFHFQITASGLNQLGISSEAELFQKIPTLEHLEAMLRATDNTVVITIRGIGDMTPRNPDSFVHINTPDLDFDRPKAVVSLGNAKADPGIFLGSTETQNDRMTWAEMDAVADKIALIFANGHPYEVLADKAGGKVIPRAANQPPFDDTRRDDLGTTHHDAGTMRMGNNIADAVTNDFGRIHDTTNCYVAGPALFPTVGSPNPMLTGVALAKRTGDLLNGSILPKPEAFVFAPDELADNQAATAAGKTLPWKALFDGTAATFGRWRLAGPGGGGMLHLNGEMVSYGTGGLRLFYYAAEDFGDFTLRLQFKIFDATNHNSGVFVRFQRPTLDLTIDDAEGRIQREPFFDRGNPAWKTVVTGFEVQIDDTASPDGLDKHRTGAIYNIPTGQNGEPVLQTYTRGPALVPNAWFEYEIVAQGSDYTVFLTDTRNPASRTQTTFFHNTDIHRGVSRGFIGVQPYSGSTVAWRHIRIKT